MSHLKEAKMNINNISTEALAALIDVCPGLEVLWFSGGNMPKLPDNFGKLTKLKSLNIRKFDKSWKEMPVLPSLEELNLNNSEMDLALLLYIIDNYKNLKTLKIPNNKLEVLPEEIVKMPNLVTLDISNNLVKHLPEGIVESTIRELIVNNSTQNK